MLFVAEILDKELISPASLLIAALVLAVSTAAYYGLRASALVPLLVGWYSLRASVAVALAKLRAIVTLSRNRAPFAGSTVISAPWLDRALRDAQLLPSAAPRVASVEVRGMDGNRGLAGVMMRAHVTYSDETTAASTFAPSTVIVKQTLATLAGRRSAIASGSTREATFYQRSSCAPISVDPSLLPRVAHAEGSTSLGEHVIVMEDLNDAASHPGTVATGANLVLGNQIWGVPDASIVRSDAEKVATLRRIFASAARMHGANWKNRALIDTPWLKAADWYRGRGRSSWESAILVGRRSWAKAKAKFADPASGVTFDPKLVACIDRSYNVTSWAALQSHLRDARVPFTLCHGDFHAANMFLVNQAGAPAAAETLKMFDWSEVGPWEPTTDLAQMLISDVPAALCAQHSRALVTHYWEELVRAGVSADEYPFDTCWAAFCRGGAERWIWVFSVLASFPVPAKLVQYFHDQLFGFIEAHGNQAEFELKSVVLLCP